MNYSPEQFEALHVEVEEQGGAIHPDACMPHDVHFEKPPYKHKRVFRNLTTGCRNKARFVIEYETENEKEPGFFTACAVDDDMGKWPRFKDAVSNATDGPEDEGDL